MMVLMKGSVRLCVWGYAEAHCPAKFLFFGLNPVFQQLAVVGPGRLSLSVPD